MSSLTFPELRAAMFKQYLAGEYTQALALVDRYAPALPKFRSHTLIWQVCLQSVTGQTELALQTLQTGLDEGLWYSPIALRSDTDLAPLQGHPEFERMVAHCTEHYEEARRRARPQLTVIEPQTGQPPYPVVIALHGRGSSAAEMADYWNDLADHGWMVALPQSSQLMGQEAFGWDDRELAQVELAAHLENLCEKHAVDVKRIVLAGFSQGAGLAIYLAGQGKLPAAGFLGVAPFLRDVDELILMEAAPLDHPLRGYLITGELDQDEGLFDKLETWLQHRHIPYKRAVYADLAHDYPPDFPEVCQEALGYIFAEQNVTDKNSIPSNRTE